jgi:selenocysteine lyase/cysteine desulfurase
LEVVADRGFNTSATFRRWAQFQMGRQGVESALRISPHYYNTEDEIDRFALALRDVTGTV